MHEFRNVLSWISIVGLYCISYLHASTYAYTKLDVPSASSGGTYGFVINDSAQVVGYYGNLSGTDGFFRRNELRHH